MKRSKKILALLLALTLGFRCLGYDVLALLLVLLLHVEKEFLARLFGHHLVVELDWRNDSWVQNPFELIMQPFPQDGPADTFETS